MYNQGASWLSISLPVCFDHSYKSFYLIFMENLHTLRIKQNGLLTSYLHNTYHANIDSFVLSWHAANCQFNLIKVTLIGEIQILRRRGFGGRWQNSLLLCNWYQHHSDVIRTSIPDGFTSDFVTRVLEARGNWVELYIFQSCKSFRVGHYNFHYALLVARLSLVFALERH